FVFVYFFFSSRRRHTRFSRDWSSDVCSSDLVAGYPCRSEIGGNRSCRGRRAQGSGRAAWARASAAPPRRGTADRGSARSPSAAPDRKSTRLNSSHVKISYAVFCLKKKKNKES